VDVTREPNLDRLLRIASVYEALADTGTIAAYRRSAAFVAATAYQIVGRVGAASGVQSADLLSASAIHPLVAAPLLFLIAGQSPDAREAGRRLQGLTTVAASGSMRPTDVSDTGASWSCGRNGAADPRYRPGALALTGPKVVVEKRP
jgi:hypothetical protein